MSPADAPPPAPARGRLRAEIAAGDPDGTNRLIAALAPADPAAVLVFGAPSGGLAALSGALAEALGCAVAGCSSAGEIGAAGYVSGTVQAIALPRDSFRVRPVVLRDQAHVPVSDWQAALRAAQAELPPRPGRAQFGLVLADGTASQEDVLVAALAAVFPDLPIVGGTAGDGLAFGPTAQVLDGRALPGAALFLLVDTALRVAEVAFAPFAPTDRRAVVTAADAAGRTILELNAEPAAEEYARLAGLAADRMGPADFARHPLLLRTGRRHHVRAISGPTAAGGLRLMSGIETGTVLTLGRAGALTEGFAAVIEALPRPPLMVLGFDCILRRLAIERAGEAAAMSALFRRFRVAGFNTYGEQHCGMHVNQTFVGLALMPPAGDGAGADDAA